MKLREKKLIIDAYPLVDEHFSGVGHSLLGLLRGLDGRVDNSKSLSVVLFCPTDKLEALKAFGFKNFSYKGLPYSSGQITDMRIRNRLLPLDLKLGKGFYFFPNFFSWPLLFSKSVTLIHDMSFELFPEFVDPPNQRLLSSQALKSVKRSTYIATVSPNARDEIVSHYKVESTRVVVLPNAVNGSLFYPRNKSDINKATKKYGVIGRYFLFVGNIEPRKNIVRLIQAYTQLPKQVRDGVGLLLIGGNGWNDGEIQLAIKEALQGGLNIMRPKKYVEDADLPALYSGAEALVYVPIYEGFGMPPLEAMSCGVPVVSSQASSLPWVVGDAAIKVEANRTDQISEAMTRVLNPAIRKKLIGEGEKQLQKFSWDKSAKILLKLFKYS